MLFLYFIHDIVITVSIQLVAEESTWFPRVYGGSRAARVGTYPDARDIEIRIEAAAFQGRPVAMRLLEPWNRTRAEETAELAARARASEIVQQVTFNLMILAAIFVAWRNLRLARGDRKTAFRFAHLPGRRTPAMDCWGAPCRGPG